MDFRVGKIFFFGAMRNRHMVGQGRKLKSKEGIIGKNRRLKPFDHCIYIDYWFCFLIFKSYYIREIIHLVDSLADFTDFTKYAKNIMLIGKNKIQNVESLFQAQLHAYKRKKTNCIMQII